MDVGIRKLNLHHTKSTECVIGLGRGVISFRLKNGWTEEESLKIKDGRKTKRAALERMEEGEK